MHRVPDAVQHLPAMRSIKAGSTSRSRYFRIPDRQRIACALRSIRGTLHVAKEAAREGQNG
jgi:hypothetical protein